MIQMMTMKWMVIKRHVKGPTGGDDWMKKYWNVDGGPSQYRYVPN